MPYPPLATIILTIGVVGAFTLCGSTRDLIVLLIFGFFGVAFEGFGFSVPALILGLVFRADC